MSKSLVSLSKSHHVVYNKETKSYELIDLETGESVDSGTLPSSLGAYAYNTHMAKLICQQVVEGKSILTISNDPMFPPLAVIQSWRRMFPDFEEALGVARKMRADVMHDKALAIADDMAANGANMSKTEIEAKKAATATYQWSAERSDPASYGARPTVVAQSAPATIIINTGIKREPKTVEVTDVRRRLIGREEGRGEPSESLGSQEKSRRIHEGECSGPDGREQDEDRMGEEG